MDKIGYYCGRIQEGFWGEPLNARSNGAFLLEAGIALVLWLGNRPFDRGQLALIVMAAAIGVGSFIFHTTPSSLTLQLDLIPFQVFGLFYFFYVGVRHFRAPGWQVASASAAFFVVRQAWILLVPGGALGGGITHIPTLVLLALCAVVLRSREAPLGRYLWLGCASYVTALMVRTFELPVCLVFPVGVHWVWHLLTAATVGILLTGILCAPTKGLRAAEGGRG